METIVISIAAIGIMIFIGFLAEKTGYVSGLKEKTGKVVTHITLPLLVITTMNTYSFDRDSVREILLVVGLAAIAIALLLLTGVLTAKICRVNDFSKPVHICLSGFGNVVFLAYPLITALFGQQGLIYAVFYGLVNDMCLYTAGIFIISKGQGQSWKRLVNPNTLSMLLGVGLLLFGIKLPSVLLDPLATVGKATTPLSMLFIGASLASVGAKEVFKRPGAYAIIAVKMILFPLAAIFALRFLPELLPWNIPAVLLCVVVLQIAMPCQSVMAILAGEYGADGVYATECTFLTTLAGLITLPFVYFALQFL